MTAASDMSAPRLADLEVLYDTHHRQALGLAYRILGDRGDAEEVVQEVFLSAWRTAQQYDPARGSSHAWILAMVRNRSIDVLRARRRRPVQPLVEGEDPPGTEDVPAQAVSNVDADAARVAMNSLPPEQKPWLFLAPLTDVLVQGVMLAHMKETGISRIALANADSAFGTSGREPLGNQAEQYGVKIVAQQTFGNTDKDVTPQLTNIRGSDAQAVVIWSSGPVTAIATRNYRQLGIKVPLYLSHAGNDFNFVRLSMVVSAPSIAIVSVISRITCDGSISVLFRTSDTSSMSVAC